MHTVLPLFKCVFPDLEKNTVYQVRVSAMTVNGSGPATQWFQGTTYRDDLDGEFLVPKYLHVDCIRLISEYTIVLFFSYRWCLYWCWNAIYQILMYVIYQYWKSLRIAHFRKLILSMFFCKFPESSVPGKPADLFCTPKANSILVSWAPPPPSSRVLVKGYVLGYGAGVPDDMQHFLSAETTHFNIENLSKWIDNYLILCYLISSFIF